MCTWTSLLLLLGVAQADFLVKKLFTDPACTNEFLVRRLLFPSHWPPNGILSLSSTPLPHRQHPQQYYIRPSGCMLPGFGSPLGPETVECSGPSASFTKTFAVGDNTCTGLPLTTSPTPNYEVFGSGNPLPSYACSKGSNNSACCAVPAPHPSSLPSRPRSPRASPPLHHAQSTTRRSASLGPQMPCTLALASAPMPPWFNLPLVKPPAPPPAHPLHPSTSPP